MQHGEWPEADQTAALRERVAAECRRLADDAALRGKAAKALKAVLGKGVLERPPRLAAVLRKRAKTFPADERERAGVAALWADLERWVSEAPQRLRREMAHGLQALSQRRGIPLTVVSKEDPVEVRLCPLALRLDFRRGKATFFFARHPLREAPLELRAVEKAYDAAVAELAWPGFDPLHFHEACRRAYLQSLVETGRRPGERVELLSFLPLIAMQMQPARFRENPDRSTFRPYTRAHLAYDVLRLRRAGCLAAGGWRLNLGVATGASAQQKKRVIYFEDERGQGEYKLTIFFTRADEAAQEDTA